MRKLGAWGFAFVVITFVTSVAEARGELRFHIPDGWKRMWEAPGNAAPDLSAEDRAKLESNHVILAAVEPSIEDSSMAVSILAHDPVQTDEGLDAFVEGLPGRMGEVTVVSRGFFDVHGAKAGRIVVDHVKGPVAKRAALYLLPGDHEQALVTFDLPAARFDGALRRIEASVQATTGLADDSAARRRSLARWTGAGAGATLGAVGALVFFLRRRKRAA